ncbi:hypothetical protein ACF09H_11420 [Streptomyces sp. NPDC014983]
MNRFGKATVAGIAIIMAVLGSVEVSATRQQETAVSATTAPAGDTGWG